MKAEGIFNTFGGNTMNDMIRIDDEYIKWLKNIKNRFKKTQIKAAIKVNEEMLRFYWSLGRDIVEMQAESKWGSSFFDTLSEDLRKMFPGTKGFSTTNLRYMKRYYDMFGEILPQLEAELSDITNLPQVGAEIYAIPWGHIKVIVDKCKGNPEKALFFVDEVIKNNWSRAVLLNFLDTNLYERQGKAISNFKTTLPAYTGDLAQEITKDPYNFDFVTVNRDYNERELKDALTEKVIKLLMEMGKGFAFVGREYPLPIEGTEEYIDLLFYHLNLHCYVVVEVKVKEFKSRDIGQIGTYINIVDDIVRTNSDGKTIGLIICKEKNNVLAKYAVNSSNEPIAISAYELSNFLPDDLASMLPSTEELESRLALDEALEDDE